MHRTSPLRASMLPLLLLAGGGALEAQTAEQVRAVLEARVGDLRLLQVPASLGDFPQPRLPSGVPDPRFAITEPKRYLGKLLFHDPIRSNNVRPEFGGDATTSQTASCGSCHLGEAASKAGQVVNLGLGGEGRMVMDIRGAFTLTRQAIPGLVDLIPTPMLRKDPAGNVILDGSFDAVDSVPRLSPSLVGYAFNTRLLWDGVAGEPDDPSNPSNPLKNPDGLEAGENLPQIAMKAHRMFGTQQEALQENAVYRELFARAFPTEHQAYRISGNLDDYINDETVLRALAAFLRSVMTRNTPWDRFLAGDGSALSFRQLRGAWLFAASSESGGANCLSCHSGPALNKQLGDEEGLLVEENFHNLGLHDHPLQDLARAALLDPAHRDRGRQGVTGDPAQAFAFKTPTLRQLKHAGQFMHSGELGSLADVVEYFNAGVPSFAEAGAAASISPRFSSPRGGGTTGLSLSTGDREALLDFLENALFDPAFERHDPSSTTETFDPNIADLSYDEDLEALGAVDGLLPSLMAVGSNDAQTRAETVFVRGRINGDLVIDLSDAVFALSFLLGGGRAPEPMVAADVNYDEQVDLSDPIYLLNHLYRGGPTIPMPYPEAGQLMH